MQDRLNIFQLSSPTCSDRLWHRAQTDDHPGVFLAVIRLKWTHLLIKQHQLHTNWSLAFLVSVYKQRQKRKGGEKSCAGTRGQANTTNWCITGPNSNTVKQSEFISRKLWSKWNITHGSKALTCIHDGVHFQDGDVTLVQRDFVTQWDRVFLLFIWLWENQRTFVILFAQTKLRSLH